MRQLIRNLVLPFLLMTAAPTAIAAPITVDFTGTMSVSVDAFNVLGGLPSPIAFSGSYSYEALTPDGDGSANSGLFLSTALGSGIQVSFASFTVATDPLNPFLRVTTTDQPPGTPADIFSIRSLSVGGTGFPPGWEFQVLIDLADPTATMLTSDALPSGAPDLSLADVNFFQIVGGPDPMNIGSLNLSGSFTSLRLRNGAAAVPEPSAALVFSAGLLVVGLRLRRP